MVSQSAFHGFLGEAHKSFNSGSLHWTAMNISYSTFPISNQLPPEIEEVGHDFIKACAFLLVPTELLYFSIYFHTKGAYNVYKVLTLLSIAAFWISPFAAPIGCGPVQCLQNFASTPDVLKSRSPTC